MRIEIVFAAFAIIAVIDKITGNRFKLGDEFDKGIMTTGPLIISMSGMLVLAPVLSAALSFAFKPMLEFFGIDLSSIAAFFPSDSGGAPMAYALSDNVPVRGYNGIIVASMFGATICPVIPMALQMIDKKYHEDVLLGFLCGFATIPLGCIVAGLMIGLSIFEILLNTAPVIILAIFICLGLIKSPDRVRKILGFVGSTLFVVVLVGLAIGIVDSLTGIKILPTISPLEDAFLIIGNIAIILAGVFPLLAIISKIFNPLFMKVGKALKIDNTSVLGLITSLANAIPVFSLIEKMSKKGRVMNMAFMVSAGFVFGDHLAFALSFDNAFALPMVVGKIVGGISALVLSNMILMKGTEENE